MYYTQWIFLQLNLRVVQALTNFFGFAIPKHYYLLDCRLFNIKQYFSENIVVNSFLKLNFWRFPILGTPFHFHNSFQFWFVLTNLAIFLGSNSVTVLSVTDNSIQSKMTFVLYFVYYSFSTLTPWGYPLFCL